VSAINSANAREPRRRQPSLAALQSDPVGVRLVIFVRERFPLLAYGPLIVAFVSCGWIAAARGAGDAPSLGWQTVVTLLVVTLVFFRLRVADEIKDADVDRVGRPDRPLPRGLVTKTELERVLVACAVVEIALATILGASVVVAYCVVLAFTILAANDFMTPGLRGNVLAYAVAHAPIVALLLVFVWWAHPSATWSGTLSSAAVLASCASFALEIGRKTMAPSEERPSVQTYSAEIGLAPAVTIATLVLVAGTLAGVVYGQMTHAPDGALVMALAVGASTTVVGVGAMHAGRAAAWRPYVGAVALGLLCWPAALELVRAWALW